MHTNVSCSKVSDRMIELMTYRGRIRGLENVLNISKLIMLAKCVVYLRLQDVKERRTDIMPFYIYEF